MARSTPWAILLTKWNDDNVEPRSRQFFEELFTTAGTGSFDMTELGPLPPPSGLRADRAS